MRILVVLFALNIIVMSIIGIGNEEPVKDVITTPQHFEPLEAPAKSKTIGELLLEYTKAAAEVK